MLLLAISLAAACPDSRVLAERYRRSLGTTVGASLRLDGHHGQAAWHGLRSAAGYRYTAALGNLADTRGDDGKTLWRQGVDGFVGYAGAHRRQIEQTLARILNGNILSDPSDDSGCIRLRKIGYALRTFYPRNSAPAKVGFDARTGDITFAWVEPSGASVRLDNIGYLKSRRGQLIGSWRFGYTEFHADRVAFVQQDIGVQLTSPLQPSSPLKEPLRIPAVYDPRHDTIVTTVTINGVQGHFMVDSGANSLVLNTAFAKRAKVRPHRPRRLSARPVHTGLSSTAVRDPRALTHSIKTRSCAWMITYFQLRCRRRTPGILEIHDRPWTT
jgi:gag-polyprotein putative aspartyl protease